VQVLDATFEPPPDVQQRIQAARATLPVRLVVPRERAWVVDRFAESVRVTQADDDLELVADVLPPVVERVGLMLTLAGPQAFVVEPADLHDAGARTARLLLDHHSLG
jgi:proteasome accessory factor C